MTLEKEFAQMEEAHRNFLVAYDGLTQKKVKARATDARKALKEMMDLSKQMRKSIMDYKEKL